MIKRNKTLKMFSTLIIFLMVVTIVSAEHNIIADNNELLIQSKNQYQLQTGETVNVNVSRLQIQNQIQNQLYERFQIQGADVENISLVEVTDKNNKQVLAYQINEQFEGKLFGLFKKQFKVQTQINAETGEVIKLGVPWYGWMMRFNE